MSRIRLKLVAWYEDQDLREVSHVGLEWWVKQMKLRNGEAALFTNRAKSRVRMIIVSDGLPLLILFPAETGYKMLSRLVEAALNWTVRNCSIDSEIMYSLREVMPGMRVLAAA